MQHPLTHTSCRQHPRPHPSRLRPARLPVVQTPVWDTAGDSLAAGRQHMGFLHPPSIAPPWSVVIRAGQVGHEVTNKQDVVALLMTLI